MNKSEEIHHENLRLKKNLEKVETTLHVKTQEFDKLFENFNKTMIYSSVTYKGFREVLIRSKSS